MLLEDRAVTPTTEAEAVRLARDLYGLEASATPLPGEHDNNFHLVTRDGRAFVLKIMHPSREQSFIDMQVRALQHLAGTFAAAPASRVVPTTNGHPFTSVSANDNDNDGSIRFVWLLTFVRGTVLAHARPQSLELLQSEGRLLGEIDKALADFYHPAALRELKWDSSRAIWIREFIPHVGVRAAASWSSTFSASSSRK